MPYFVQQSRADGNDRRPACVIKKHERYGGGEGKTNGNRYLPALKLHPSRKRYPPLKSRRDCAERH